MYIRLLSKTLLELDNQVIAFYPEPEKLTTWLKANCPEQIQQFHAFPMQESKPVSLPILGRLPQPFNVLRRWHHAANTIKKASSQLGYAPDLVFFNWIDSYLSNYLSYPIIDQIFPYPWSGICFQPRLQFNPSQPKRQGWVDYQAVLNSPRCRSVAVMDEGHATLLQDKISSPVVTFPDLTDESPPDPDFSVVNQLYEKARGRKIIGLLGSLNKRKGLLTLLAVAQKSQQENWFFAFVGQLSPYLFAPEELTRIKDFAKSPPSNCFFHLELIPDEPQFNAVVNACDILFAAYENFPYSSNLLTKAAVFRKLVIASEEFCIGERVRRFRLGITIEQGNVGGCIKALHELCDHPDSSLAKLQPDFTGCHQRHSASQLRTVLEEILANA